MEGSKMTPRAYGMRWSRQPIREGKAGGWTVSIGSAEKTGYGQAGWGPAAQAWPQWSSSFPEHEISKLPGHTKHRKACVYEGV